jgi:hypothetical protein
MLGGGKGRRPFSRHPEPESYTPHAGTDHQKHQALETWDAIKGALIGVAATRFKDLVGEIVPGFSEQFQKTQSEKNRSLPLGPSAGSYALRGDGN